MTKPDLVSRATDNLERTYLAIGLGTPGASVSEGPGYTACVCGFDHPVGNFALVRSPDFGGARELARIAKTKRGFHAYALPGSSAGDVLSEAGFRRSYALAALAAEGREEDADVQCAETSSELERLETAEFMVRQFFSRADSAARSRIAHATLQSGLELSSFWKQGESFGAVMVSRTPGLLGIYNLCVDAKMRGRGLGSLAVRSLLHRAYVERRTAVLQCDPSLEGWYDGLSFHRIALIQVFSLGARRG